MLSKDIKSIVNKYWSYEHEKYNKLKKEYADKCYYDYTTIFMDCFFNWRLSIYDYESGYHFSKVAFLLPKKYKFSSGFNNVYGYY